MALAHHALAGQLSIPVLGVCLGHQALALADGMEVVPSPHGPVHGVPVRIEHDGTGLFATSTSPEAFTRYNSLVVNENEGHSFIINGRESETGLVMGIRHSSHPIHGVQFHPESIGSPEGRAIIQEFLQNPSDG
jgi:anthranilate synthase/aminodeoxychorismate synthase-like glutamine amidotransferase